MKNNENKHGRHVSPFATYALSDPEKRRGQQKTTVPSEAAVKEAKDWVDHNQK